VVTFTPVPATPMTVSPRMVPRDAVPVTVRLSATVTSEVPCPIVTAIPEVSVAIFRAPTAFLI